MESLFALPEAAVGAAASPPRSFSFAPAYTCASPPPPSASQAWSSPSACSSEGAASPASDDASARLSAAAPPLDRDWEILSDLLIDEALSALPGVGLSPSAAPNSAQSAQLRQSEASPASPFAGALPAGYSSSSSSVGVAKTQTAKKAPRGRGRGRKVADAGVKKEPLTLEEQKKQRRRSQIASSVQRHREKKKCLVESLQADMGRLSAQLAQLRAQRRAQLADNDQLVAYEEEAMTQRRKRKQAEHKNQVLKQALFQQTAFLGGMRALMGGSGMPHARTMEFHDWVHSYTALASRDALARRKEYVAHFPQSKMELANKLVLKDTEEDTQRLLATGRVFSGKVKMLHDGTRDALELDGGYTDVVMRELFGQPNGDCNTDDAGDGRVIKEFSSVFLFRESPECTLDTLTDLVFTSMRSIGVYYPGSVYQSRSVDEVYQDEEDGVTKSRVFYTDLAASMEPILEIVDETREADDIKVEARVLTRESRSKDEGMILWDYVDDDSLHPMPVDTGSRTIRRNVCGGMVIRREPGTGMLSVRHVSIKGYCPLDKAKDATMMPSSSDAEEARRAVSRRIGLQATEYERTKDRCVRYVFNDITRRLGDLHVS
ncbi:serine/threonine-protein kinase drkB [Phytophthora cinnamomi]|uniref:serine/threonine-protein kinase drkB n=1 Tax=Phytophthora cinnamomi TaxID=4785 RepID=UPI0035598E6F|nr:serine/threonine-protein kinase drkB [Phytophthora cinnamomi]